MQTNLGRNILIYYFSHYSNTYFKSFTFLLFYENTYQTKNPEIFSLA